MLSKRNSPWIQTRENANKNIKRTFQRRRCCVFDSPGLTSESVVYPGLFAISERNAVGVVSFCFPYTILPLIINYITLTIVSSCNSVRVVLLIARGWRGTSLPRVSIHKEIQRRRCWAFSMKACLQWNLLWRINKKKRNTYGVETFFLYSCSRFLAFEFMANCA